MALAHKYGRYSLRPYLLYGGQDAEFVINQNVMFRGKPLALITATEHYGSVINRPFDGGYLFSGVGDRPLPAFAREIDCENWAQFFLKFVVSHPAVTCAIPATSKIAHLAQNMGALYGRLPDADMRKHMARLMEPA